MIRFLSFFLGLTFGVHAVHLGVEGPVAAVDVLVDGRPVSHLEAPPWVLEADFGPPRPLRLTAVARDRSGRELGRVEQLVNVPRPRAEARFVLVRDRAGRPREARLEWEALDAAEPSDATVTLDGAPLATAGLPRFELPPLDLQEIHLLRAELRFGDAVWASAEAVFGGSFGEELSRQLTAVPLAVDRGVRLPEASGMAGWLRAAGKPVAVVAVDRRPLANIAFVPDPLAAPGLGLLKKGSWEVVQDLDPEIRRLLIAGRTTDRDELSYYATRPAASPDGRGEYELFQPWVVPTRWRARGFFAFLTRYLPAPLVEELRAAGDDVPERRLVDAAAVAGLNAAAGGRARAVVVLLGDAAWDESRLSVADLRAFLAASRVPLRVWTVARGGVRSGQAAWGRLESVADLPGYRRAVDGLRDLLAAERVVWVEGRYLPREITLGPAARGARLLGEGEGEAPVEAPEEAQHRSAGGG